MADRRMPTWMLSCKHLVLGTEQTDLHKDFLQMYEDAKEFGKITKALIDRTKGFVQPIPKWKQYVLTPAGEYTSLELFGDLLKEIGDSLKASSPKIWEFYTVKSKALHEMNRVNKEFQHHVQLHTLKPLEKYVDEDLVKIKTEFDEMVRTKKVFDDERNKLQTCKQDKIEDHAKSTEDAKNAFEQKAVLVTELLQKLPEHIEKQRMAIRQLALGYRLYHEKSRDVVGKLLTDTQKTV